MSFVQCMITRRPSFHHATSTITPKIIQPSQTTNRNITASVLCSSPASVNHTVETPQVSLQLHADSDENQPGSCTECLFTGVATCTGLSLYFLKMASEVPTQATAKMALKEAMRQKRFLLGSSAVSAAAGAYRLYIG